MNVIIKELIVFKFMCHDQVLESIMTGQPTCISTISTFSWWELVMYKKDVQSYSFSPYYIERCYGVNNDIETDLTYIVY